MSLKAKLARYPRSHVERRVLRGKRGRNPKRCAVCGEPSTCVRVIEWTWMRGDDDVEPRCDRCKRLLPEAEARRWATEREKWEGLRRRFDG